MLLPGCAGVRYETRAHPQVTPAAQRQYSTQTASWSALRRTLSRSTFTSQIAVDQAGVWRRRPRLSVAHLHRRLYTGKPPPFVSGTVRSCIPLLYSLPLTYVTEFHHVNTPDVPLLSEDRRRFLPKDYQRNLRTTLQWGSVGSNFIIGDSGARASL